MKNTLLRASFIALALAVMNGCATTQQLDEVRAIAEGARSSASNASSQASSALSTANQALDAARAAQDCCDANTSKIDRAFEQAMQK